MYKLFLYFILFLLTGIPSYSQTIQIHLDGMQHGKESFAKNGEEWFGLFIQDDRCELKKTTLKVSTVFDAVIDNGDVKTGQLIETEYGRNPLVLIRGFDLLQEGDVNTVFIKKSKPGKFIYPGEDLYLPLTHTNIFHLFSFGNASYDHGVKYINNQWEIHWTIGHTNLTQVLERFEPFDYESLPSVIWAGDLDRDNKIDILLDNSISMYTRNYVLYLSSQATHGNLMKKVAEFFQSSC